MQTWNSVFRAQRLSCGRSSALSSLSTGEPCGHRTQRFVRPLRAVNNQHHHIDEELVRMQSQLLVQAPQTSHSVSETHQRRHTQHVVHDTQLHPYQRQPQRHVHHENQRLDSPADADVHGGELCDAVELSYQYSSSNIVNYRTDPPPTPRVIVHRARVLDYTHPSVLARDVVLTLLSGGKLLLELPDEPAAVSSLMTALGHAAAKLRSFGFATALDPIYDPATGAHGCSTNCHGSGNTNHSHSTGPPVNGQNYHHHHSSHGSGDRGGGGGGGSPSASHDFSSPGGGAATRRAHDSGCSTHVFCARAVPMPPPAEAAGATATYTVGSSIGQEVLRVGPSVGVHALLPVLLRAVLRDGLVTLRCCWFDEELGAETWPRDDEVTAAGAYENPTALGVDREGCDETCDGSGLWGSGRSGSPGSPTGSAAGAQPSVPPPEVLVQPHALLQRSPAASPTGSLVRVPCVLRAIFKLDRQLRGLDLGGLVVLPHAFARSYRDKNTQVLYLDVVIA